MVFEAHSMSYRTLIIQLCQGKYSFLFYGTFKADFEADLHPRGLARFAACRRWFFVQKILYCVVSLQLFICSRSRRSVLELKSKYQTCLIFTTLDRAASDVIPAIANESEQASLADVACFYSSDGKFGSYSWNLAATNMPRKQRISPIFFFNTLFFTVKQNAPGEPADNVDCPLFVLLL